MKTNSICQQEIKGQTSSQKMITELLLSADVALLKRKNKTKLSPVESVSTITLIFFYSLFAGFKYIEYESNFSTSLFIRNVAFVLW